MHFGLIFLENPKPPAGARKGSAAWRPARLGPEDRSERNGALQAVPRIRVD